MRIKCRKVHIMRVFKTKREEVYCIVGRHRSKAMCRNKIALVANGGEYWHSE